MTTDERRAAAQLNPRALVVTPELVRALTIHPTNTCFDDALDYIEMLASSGVTPAVLNEHHVVHGVCLWPQNQPGSESESDRRFAHGWVERGEWAIQCGLIEGVRVYYQMPRDQMHEYLRVQRFTRYTLREALHHNEQSGHYGPWDLDYWMLCRHSPRAGAWHSL